MEQKVLGHIPGIIGRLVRKGRGKEREREREREKHNRTVGIRHLNVCVCVERRMIQIWTNMSTTLCEELMYMYILIHTVYTYLLM